MKIRAYSGVLLFMLMIFLIPGNLKAQNVVLKIADYTVNEFNIDPLGTVYLKIAGNTVKKLDSNGELVFNEVKKYGELTTIVTENPWKTLLFYKNYSTIVLLDKYFNVISSVDFRKQNIYSISAVTTSYDNNLWLFDEETKRLKKTDEAGNLLMQTEDFRILFDKVPSPEKLLDRDGFIYLYDSQNGLYTFDYYGSLKSHQPYTAWIDFTVIKKSVYGCNERNIYKYSPPLPQLENFGLPFTIGDSKLVKLKNNKLYVLVNKELREYSLEVLTGKINER